jgi:hypothetical protein
MDKHLDELLSQDDLMENFLIPFKLEIKNTSGLYNKHVCEWSAENYVPFPQFNEGEVLVVFYEKLRRQPQHEIEIAMILVVEKSLRVHSFKPRHRALSVGK